MTRFAMFALLAAAPAALAQESESPAENVTYAAETLVDFTEVSVTGELAKPHIVWVSAEQRAGFTSLVQLRVSWNPELRDSVDEVN